MLPGTHQVKKAAGRPHSLRTRGHQAGGEFGLRGGASSLLRATVVPTRIFGVLCRCWKPTATISNSQHAVGFGRPVGRGPMARPDEDGVVCGRRAPRFRGRPLACGLTRRARAAAERRAPAARRALRATGARSGRRPWAVVAGSGRGVRPGSSGAEETLPARARVEQASTSGTAATVNPGSGSRLCDL